MKASDIAKAVSKAVRVDVKRSRGRIADLEDASLTDWDAGSHPDTTDERTMARAFVGFVAARGCHGYGLSITTAVLAYLKSKKVRTSVVGLADLATALTTEGVTQQVVEESFDATFPYP